MSDLIRDALEQLIDRMMNECASSATVDAWAAEARAICAALADSPPPAPVAWPELPDCPEEWRTGDGADTEYVGGLRVGYRNARNKLATMNPNHQENHQ